mmetsp:Transcript_21416/g.31835  ORF Transcript_21416/g.31835 Transcript_21416/m.31835 type:complete len:582 (-) Transcript_21416:96-1841(-)
MEVEDKDAETFGLASFFLGVAYAGISVWSFRQLRKIREFVTGWSTERSFFYFIVVHLCIRTLTWATLCWTYFTGRKAMYAYMAILQTFPETLFIAAYLLLFMQWVEIYIFTHDQFIFPSRTFFHRRWRGFYLAVVSMIFCALAIFYILLFSNQIGNADSDLAVINLAQAIFNFILPGLFIITWSYFSFGFSGFGYSSTVDYRRLVKLNYLVFGWTVGRLIRGVAFWWDSKSHTLSGSLNAMILVVIMVITELIPFLFTWDSEIVSLLLLSEEGNALRISRQGSQNDYKLLEDDEKDLVNTERDQKLYTIDPLELQFLPREGTVKKGTFCVTQIAKLRGKRVFIKTFRFTGVSPAMIQSLSDDLIIKSKIQHPRFVKFIGVFQVRSCISRVTEFCDCGSLRDILRECTRPLLPATVLRIALGICEGMEFLHDVEPKMAHGYLSSTNVMLGEDMDVKIADFGLRRIKTCMELTSLQRCFTGFTAPEMFYGSAPTRSSDMYSFAWICWEMLSREPPFDGKNIQVIKDFVTSKSSPPKIPKVPSLPKDFHEVMHLAWSHEPKTRPRFSDVKIKMQNSLDAKTGEP